MKPEKTNVLIVIPTYDRRVMVDIAATLFQLAKQENDDDCEFHFEFAAAAGALGHEFARNRCVNLLRYYPKAEKVLWFDSDVGPDRETTLALLRVDADIASAVYPGFGTNGMLFQIYDTYNPKTGMFTTWYPKPDDPQVLDIAGCGFGYVVTSRKVLEDPRMQLPRTWTDQEGRVHTDPPEDIPAVFKFERHSHGQVGNGEDLNFCFRAKSLGYSIKALLRHDNGAELLASHWHQQDYRVFYEYLARMRDEAYRDGLRDGKVEADGDVTAYASAPVFDPKTVRKTGGF